MDTQSFIYSGYVRKIPWS